MMVKTNLVVKHSYEETLPLINLAKANMNTIVLCVCMEDFNLKTMHAFLSVSFPLYP